MALFPTDVNLSDIEISTVDETADTKHLDIVGRSFDFNFQTGKFIFSDGKVIEASKLKAIENWIELYIRTDILKYKIYDEDFGVDTSGLVSYRLPRGYQVAEIERRITEGILTNCPSTREVKDWNFDRGHFSFTVVLDDGEEVYINE